MTPDINLLYDRVAGRAAYIDFYLQRFRLSTKLNNIRVEHEKWLRYALCHKEGEPKRFPFFPVSQTWTALEHRCLA
ncbi:hypothetical protein FACS1894139_14390 [Planctomycetales bacterium]|nr:hypothetical protein FACS1894107_13400 [Planctomycetales bacterium]GHS97559.1 hypothetical protein FACS1894108_04140 [Planctomycetales bacterium]GHT07061.1 hypothetical protein FACS1894139_14390 [Planctomycetales bacterium]